MVRYAVQREGDFSQRGGSFGQPLGSHASLMTLADDWCPPGTGFNDAFRLVSNAVTPDIFDVSTSSIRQGVSFDPMVYFFYGEQYHNVPDSSGKRGDSNLAYYDGAGAEITTSQDWQFICKGMARFEVATDLAD